MKYASPLSIGVILSGSVFAAGLSPAAAFAEQYESGFGFNFEATANWLVVDKDDVSDYMSRELTEELGNDYFVTDAGTLDDLLGKIEQNNVEYLFDRNYSSSDFNNNISLQLNHGRSATTAAEVREVCASLPADLQQTFAQSIEMRHCKHRELNGFGFVSFSYSGSLPGVTTVQHEFQITPSINLIVVGGSYSSGFSALEDMQEHLADRITQYFGPKRGAMDRAIVELNRGNYDEALELLSWLTELGDDDALYNLGYVYEKGHGVDRDYEEALRLYTEAANLGNGLAYTNLGSMYFHAKGVDKDLEKSAEYYRVAAELGVAIAQTSYGGMLYDGVGVAKNPDEGVQWLLKAARQGDRHAGQNLESIFTIEIEEGNIGALQALGGMYFFGVGVVQDTERGLELITQAADSGWGPAKQSLVLIYEQGLHGVPIDKELAEYWRKQ